MVFYLEGLLFRAIRGCVFILFNPIGFFHFFIPSSEEYRISNNLNLLADSFPAVPVAHFK